MQISVIPKTEENIAIWQRAYKEYDAEKGEWSKEWLDLKESCKTDAVKFYKEHGPDFSRKDFWIEEVDEPKTLIEHIIDRAYFNGGFEHYSESFPEDMCEERTSWEELYEFASEMGCFIRGLFWSAQESC